MISLGGAYTHVISFFFPPPPNGRTDRGVMRLFPLYCRAIPARILDARCTRGFLFCGHPPPPPLAIEEGSPTHSHARTQRHYVLLQLYVVQRRSLACGRGGAITPTPPCNSLFPRPAKRNGRQASYLVRWWGLYTLLPSIRLTKCHM